MFMLSDAFWVFVQSNIAWTAENKAEKVTLSDIFRNLPRK